MHDRQRAVPERVELVEPAGLEPAGHEEHVGPALDAVGESVVEADLHRDARRVPLGKGAELLLQRRVTHSEQHELQPAVQQPGQRLDEEVVAFLVREPADGGGQERVLVDVESQLALERRLVGALPGQVLGRVPLRERRIDVGTPARVVHPVHDPDQVLVAVAEQPFQAGARLGTLHDLARVRRAHGGELVREDQPRLHEIELAVELERVGMEQVTR